MLRKPNTCSLVPTETLYLSCLSKRVKLWQ